VNVEDFLLLFIAGWVALLLASLIHAIVRALWKKE